MAGIPWEIWCSNRETGRFDEKLGDSYENRESWQVCYIADWDDLPSTLMSFSYLSFSPLSGLTETFLWII